VLVFQWLMGFEQTDVMEDDPLLLLEEKGCTCSAHRRYDRLVVNFNRQYYNSSQGISKM
jgi:hypothetical protein